MSGSAFDRYLDALAGSWRAYAAPHPTAVLDRGFAFIAMRHPDPVLNNAIVRTPDALPLVLEFFAGINTFAVWVAESDASPALSTLLRDEGLRPDISTRPMIATLADITLADITLPPTDPGELRRDVPPAEVAAMNGVAAAVVDGVRDLRGYSSPDGLAGLLALDADDDVNISFVVTAPQVRGQGRASALLRAALADARDRGRLTASLQATTTAENLYRRAGFVPVGRWQEWVPE